MNATTKVASKRSLGRRRRLGSANSVGWDTGTALCLSDADETRDHSISRRIVWVSRPGRLAHTEPMARGLAAAPQRPLTADARSGWPTGATATSSRFRTTVFIPPAYLADRQRMDDQRRAAGPAVAAAASAANASCAISGLGRRHRRVGRTASVPAGRGLTRASAGQRDSRASHAPDTRTSSRTRCSPGRRRVARSTTSSRSVRGPGCPRSHADDHEPRGRVGDAALSLMARARASIPRASAPSRGRRRSAGGAGAHAA
jgi:hypothetical protein